MISRAIKIIRYFFYVGGYLFKIKVLHREIPFIGGLVINEKCNLRCRQCSVSNRVGIPDLTFAEIGKGLDDFYARGIRSVFIEGGEPFLWQEGELRLDDVIQLARKKGFLLVSIYTNGTFPIEVSADTVFVSLDGMREINNELRGRGRNVFDPVIANIRKSTHPNIIINFTINSKNQHELEDFCEFASRIPQIKGLFFYFHTPYYGYDELYLTLEQKRAIIDRILVLKKKGYKILNSTACLRGVAKDDWKRPSKTCYVYANNQSYQCCRAFGNDQACKNCGYLGYPEILYILKLRPSAILAAFNYLPKK
ncbi:radical SAM protein [Methylicorpusculum sp.]|uniref:radical SAM protein n=1 Tax=Methylicorpusculum sp. TaxID=2713644 RepID=UPI002AB974A5|nr:radical SAM protein [Methylicorpusculum sp.]MDZ4151176.1 radical SAM protein [Methylicorpusculum sp.]